ncbi:glutaredoxin family protein [Patescibacteria group bacterium]|nr:glutaredoxin family protein [Patescibacteria group bacterium]
MDTSTPKEVVIYSTPTCHFCALSKDYFTKHNIPFTNYDVSSNFEKRQEMIDLTGQMGVPVIRIGDDIVIGFDKPKLAELLGIKE